MDLSSLDLFSNGTIRNPTTGKYTHVYQVKDRRTHSVLFNITTDDKDLPNKVVQLLEGYYVFKRITRNLYLQLRLLAPTTKNPQQAKERLEAADALGIVEED